MCTLYYLRLINADVSFIHDIWTGPKDGENRLSKSPVFHSEGNVIKKTWSLEGITSSPERFKYGISTDRIMFSLLRKGLTRLRQSSELDSIKLLELWCTDPGLIKDANRSSIAKKHRPVANASYPASWYLLATPDISWTSLSLTW